MKKDEILKAMGINPKTNLPTNLGEPYCRRPDDIIEKYKKGLKLLNRAREILKCRNEAFYEIQMYVQLEINYWDEKRGNRKEGR